MRSGSALAFTIVAVMTCACERRAAPTGSAPTASATEAPAPTAAVDEDADLPPASFAPATLAALKKGDLKSGARVAVDALLLTDTIIHTSSTGDHERYYMLAVTPDSAYEKALDELAKEADALVAEADSLQKLKTAKAVAEPLKALLDKLIALDKRMNELKLDAKEAVAVQLRPAGFENVALTWDTVLKECTGPGCLPNIPKIKIPDIKPMSMDTCAFAGPDAEKLKCLTDAEAQLAKLKAQDPPRLEDALPTLPPVHEFDDGKIISKFNTVVKRFNAEVERRQMAQAASLPSKAARIARRIAVSRGAGVTLRGVVEPVPEMATKTYSQTNGGAPAAHLRELRAGGETFASAFYRKTRYCIVSYPPGADVVRNGEKAGRTPLCIDDIPVGSPIELGVEQKGYRAIGTGPGKARSSVMNVTEVDCTFQKDDPEGGRCQVLQ